MTGPTLASLDVANFRSIRGQIHAPLDAKVVLVHGENGAGKTSLLSAIELALTGRIQSLERADPGYGKQLLHRSAVEGHVRVRTLEGTADKTFESLLTSAGATPVTALADTDANFFRERVFLPQSLLGQLLQIYQDAGNDASSPLSQFVGKLLALDRLDALELGLRQLNDVRNVRKIVDGWPVAENEKSRLDRLLGDQRKIRDSLNEEIRTGLEALAAVCTALGISVDVREDMLDSIAAALSGDSDTTSFAELTDQQRQLAAIQREIDAAQARNGYGPNRLLNRPGGGDPRVRAMAGCEWRAGRRYQKTHRYCAPERFASERSRTSRRNHARPASDRAQTTVRPRDTGAD